MKGVPQSRGIPKHHLSAKGCPGFIVEFNNYSISGDDPMSLTSLLHGAAHIAMTPLCAMICSTVSAPYC